jgi:hypothetical protein
MHISLFDRVVEITKHIHLKTRISIHFQHLFSVGKHLDPVFHLYDYALERNSTIFLVFGLKGGVNTPNSSYPRNGKNKGSNSSYMDSIIGNYTKGYHPINPPPTSNTKQTIHVGYSFLVEVAKVDMAMFSR